MFWGFGFRALGLASVLGLGFRALGVESGCGCPLLDWTYCQDPSTVPFMASGGLRYWVLVMELM